MPDQTRAAYKRKAAVLVELMAAQQSEAAEEVLAQKLSAFRVEIDEALLHMLSKRVQAAQTHEQVGGWVPARCCMPAPVWCPDAWRGRFATCRYLLAAW